MFQEFFQSGIDRKSINSPWCLTLLSAGIMFLTHPGIELSCVGLGSSWDTATSPIRPETPGARPWSHPWLLCQRPFVGAGVEWWMEGSISWWEGLERAARLLAACREKEKPTHQLEAAIHFSYWASVVYQKQFLSEQYLQLAHFSKRPHKTIHLFKLQQKINLRLWKHVVYNWTCSSKSTIM